MLWQEKGSKTFFQSLINSFYFYNVAGLDLAQTKSSYKWSRAFKFIVIYSMINHDI